MYVVYLWYIYGMCGIWFVVYVCYMYGGYIYIWYMVYVYGNQSKKSKHRGNMTIPTVSNGI